MKFYLGTHHASQRWFDARVPLFVSRRVLTTRKKLPRAHPFHPGWALDSGGFTELSMFGEWRTSERAYVSDVRRFAAEVGSLEWVAPQDWMCEPLILDKTGLTVEQHQLRTVGNFRRLRGELGPLVIPVIQGWERDDYLRCWEMYHRSGVDLEWEPVIGVGSVCRRQNTAEAGRIMRSLAEQLLGTQLHAFGVKLTGLESFGDVLHSADSMGLVVYSSPRPPDPGAHAQVVRELHRLRAALAHAGRGSPRSVEVGRMNTWESLLDQADREPINLDISNYSDDWCAGFLAGQVSILEEVQAGRLELPLVPQAYPPNYLGRL